MDAYIISINATAHILQYKGFQPQSKTVQQYEHNYTMTSFVMLYIIIKLSTHAGFQVQEMTV